MRKEQEKMASMMGSLWQLMQNSKHSIETTGMDKRTVTTTQKKSETNEKLETMSAKERGLDKYHRGESPRPQGNQTVESGDEL